MGEERAVRESTICNQADGVFCLDAHMQVADGIVCLCSLCGDNLICVHNDASGYNNCKFDHTLKGALMFKSEGINGEIWHAA